ncbi:MAG: cytochrome C [Rhodospirillaceae bacterium]|nr:cytochrome C [Rhodospirillaceae bacterium]|tara:strand:+ start:12277 stop:12660 length:384 start_codon:yes stop_codon:yes gene_type:complete
MTRFSHRAALVLCLLVSGTAFGNDHLVSITVPDLSGLAQGGQTIFEANCSSCHGVAGGGTEQGPPLIHIIYEPSHHADFAFVNAIRNGVRAHHWPYGDMAPVEGLTNAGIQAVIAFVREVQVAHGID